MGRRLGCAARGVVVGSREGEKFETVLDREREAVLSALLLDVLAHEVDEGGPFLVIAAEEVDEVEIVLAKSCSEDDL